MPGGYSVGGPERPADRRGGPPGNGGAAATIDCRPCICVISPFFFFSGRGRIWCRRPIQSWQVNSRVQWHYRCLMRVQRLSLFHVYVRYIFIGLGLFIRQFSHYFGNFCSFNRIITHPTQNFCIQHNLFCRYKVKEFSYRLLH